MTIQNLSAVDNQHAKLNLTPWKDSPGVVKRDMYALPDKKKSSAMLEKSSELIKYLDAKDNEEPILQNIPEYSEINSSII